VDIELPHIPTHAPEGALEGLDERNANGCRTFASSAFIELRMRFSLLLLALAPAVASAQLPRDTLNPTGMVGSVFFAPMTLSRAGERAGERGGGGIRIGFRARLPVFVPDALRLGLDGSLTVTDFRGMNTATEPYAFSSVDAGPTLSWRAARRLRVYAFGRMGKHTAEFEDDGAVWNYAAGWGTAAGLGIEIPITPEGRGLDLSVQWLQGRFGSRERLGELQPNVSVHYDAWRGAIGWSGPITISAPWR
jgi:hypothetical protein